MAKDYIANELGHTSFPKWIDHPSEKDGKYSKRILVNTPEEEKEVLSGKALKTGEPGWK